MFLIYFRPVPKPKQSSQPVKNATKARKPDGKTDEREIEPKRQPIEDMVAEKVQELVTAWPCTDEVDNESTLEQSENELNSKARIESADEKQNFEAINQEPMVTEIESLIDKIHESIEESKCLPLKVDIEEPFQKHPDNGLLEPENMLPQPKSEEMEAEQVHEESQNEPSSDKVELELTEKVEEESTHESQPGPLRTDISETPDSSSEIIPSNPTPESTTSNSLQNINYDKLLFSQTLETIDENSLHNSVSSLPNQANPKDILTNLLSCDIVEEPRLEMNKLSEEIKTSIKEIIGLGKTSRNEENVPEEKNTTIDELSEMKVHLEINPLDKDTVLFETEMEDIVCRNSDSEPKLLSAISDQSDNQHS